jgi:alpha-L-rhamnosidase
MNKIYTFIMVIFTGLIISCSPAGTNLVSVVDLSCEYLVNPLGIDVVEPRLAWKIRQTDEARNNQLQKAYQIMVASSPEKLATDSADVWNSGKVKSAQSIQVVYAGKPLESMQQCWWKVRIWNNHGEVTDWSQPAHWGMGLLKPADWQSEWIGDQPDIALKEYLSYVRTHCKEPDFDLEKWKNPPLLPSPMLRKSFGVAGEVKQALLYVSALGYYEMWMNGDRIGNQQLAPEWTDYSLRVQYQTYDLTDKLKKGDNVISAVLADGWCVGRLAPVKWRKTFPHRGFSSPDRRLITKFVIEYSDGSREIIASDGSWKINPDGFIVTADNFVGETIDARKIPTGWQLPGFDDSDWKNVYVDKEVNRNLTAQMNEPMRIHHEIKPVNITQWNDKYIVNFGQNIAGWCSLKIKGKAGTTITLRHGEWLKNDGSIYTESLGYAKATDIFTLSGGDDVFEPRFTYHGFQYVEISGLDAAPSPDMITAKAVSSDPETTGTFECSNPALNKLYSNVAWTQRNNMYSFFTDNPSRDERTAALGDIHIFQPTSMFNMNMAGFYSKMVHDLRTGGIAHNGQFFSMIPSLRDQPFWDGWIGAPGWAEAGIIVPWQMYEYYGDKRALENLYDAMKSHVDATFKENPDLIWKVRHNSNNDWLNANTILDPPEADYSTKRGMMPTDVFSTAYFAHGAKLLSTIALTLDRQDDAKYYGDLAAKIKDTFIKSYVGDDGKVEGNCQAAYALALNYDLIPDNLRDAAFAHLLECIEEYDYRLSTGFITTPMMMNELVVHNRIDVAYRLLESDRFPSWLYLVKQGATTVWERWDAYIAGRGIRMDKMNSFDHVAFGAVVEWMYRNILGINADIDHPGYEHFTIHPRTGGSLTWAKGSYNSIRGEIASSWKIENGRFILKVKIPANTTATVILPNGETKETGSGEYEFVTSY